MEPSLSRGSVPMTISCRMITYMTLVAFASGCSGSPEAGHKPDTISNEGGMSTSIDELPEAPVASNNSQGREAPSDPQQVWQEEQNLEFNRRLAALHESLAERSKPDQPIVETRDDMLQQEEIRDQKEWQSYNKVKQELGSYQSIIRQQEERLRGGQEPSNFLSVQAGRRRARLQALREQSQAELDQQQQATSDWLRMERVRLRQEERRLSGSSGGPDLFP
jgi:hypothetical protein